MIFYLLSQLLYKSVLFNPVGGCGQTTIRVGNNNTTTRKNNNIAGAVLSELV